MICLGGRAASSAARSHGRMRPRLASILTSWSAASKRSTRARMPRPPRRPHPPRPHRPPARLRCTAGAQASVATAQTQRRVLAVAAILDLLVAGAIGFGFAAAGSRLLWPVLAIAAYHAVGLIFTGRSPMLALLLDQGRSPASVAAPSAPPADAPSARPDRAPATAAARTATARLRQPSRRASRGSRGRAPN